MKPNINSVEVHPQLSNNGHPVGTCSLQEMVEKEVIFNLIAPANKGTKTPNQSMDTTCKRVKALCLSPRVYGDGPDTIFIPGILTIIYGTMYIYMCVKHPKKFLSLFLRAICIYEYTHQLLKSGKDLMPIMPIGVRCVMDGTIGYTR